MYKFSPMQGLTGYGGGAAGLGVVSGAAKAGWAGGDRGFWFGGQTDDMEYYAITGSGVSSTNFGDFGPSAYTNYPASQSNTDIVCVAGGRHASYQNMIEYFSSASAPSSTTDFGDLSVGTGYFGAAGTTFRGLFMGGYTGSATKTQIDYIDNSTTGDAGDFGDLLSSGVSANNAASNGTKAVCFAGAPANGSSNQMQYVDPATTGNAVDWDNMNVSRSQTAGGCSETRLVIGGGYNNLDDIDYKDIDSSGNASDFGNLSDARGYLAAGSNGTRLCFAGGADGITNTIDKVEIDTTADATDHGDLTINRAYGAGCSGAAS